MLTQAEANKLMMMQKRLVQKQIINFPSMGSYLKLPANSLDNRERFMFDIQRKGRVRVAKCTYIERSSTSTLLIRLDVDAPPHPNPDKTKVHSPHIHIYREGYGLKWAIPAPSELKHPDLAVVLQRFLVYCSVVGEVLVMNGVPM